MSSTVSVVFHVFILLLSVYDNSQCNANSASGTGTGGGNGTVTGNGTANGNGEGIGTGSANSTVYANGSCTATASSAAAASAYASAMAIAAVNAVRLATAAASAAASAVASASATCNAVSTTPATTTAKPTVIPACSQCGNFIIQPTADFPSGVPYVQGIDSLVYGSNSAGCTATMTCFNSAFNKTSAIYGYNVSTLVYQIDLKYNPATSMATFDCQTNGKYMNTLWNLVFANVVCAIPPTTTVVG